MISGVIAAGVVSLLAPATAAALANRSADICLTSMFCIRPAWGFKDVDAISRAHYSPQTSTSGKFAKPIWAERPIAPGTKPHSVSYSVIGQIQGGGGIPPPSALPNDQAHQ
jgi:hypothetical protein